MLPRLSRWQGRFLSFAIAVILCLLAAPARTFAQPTANVTITELPVESLIGEQVVFKVTLDNGASGANTGYGPYIDLVLPAIGNDGAGAAVDDGISFVGATYLGVPVTATVLTFDAGGNATHPYARDSGGNPVIVTGTPGNQLVVLQLPFGSFTSSQTPATVLVTTALSNLADANVSLQIRARGGFQYGADALDNPGADPSIIGSYANANTTPTLIRLKKTYIGPEDETATGPNFPRQYLIEADIANGQTLTNFDLTDVLPASMQYVQVDATTIRGSAQATTAPSTPSTTVPGGTLTRRFASVTGTTATNDATLLFTFYIPRVSATSAVIINATSGDDTTSIDDAKAQGNWAPIDSRDATGPVSSDATANDHTLTDKSIAIQKSVAIVNDTGATGPSPGDTLEYTLQIQVSDFFAFNNLVATDLIGDGLRRDMTFTPTLRFTQHGSVSGPAGMAPSSFSFVVNTLPPNPGKTTATFQISNELISRALDGNALGGCVPDGGTGGPAPDCTAFNGGGTTMTIVYRVIIQENYSDDYPSGDQSVDEGDVLKNDVVVAGDLLSVATLAPQGTNESDDSHEEVIIVRGQLSKAIYAINGSTSFSSPLKVAPGDTVTYRIRLTLPTSDFEPLDLIDFLPLPIFNAATLTTFDDVTSATAPAAGHAQFGPNDTFRAFAGPVDGVPSMTTDATGNSVKFHYNWFDSASSPSTQIEILLSVVVSNQPFADGLFLTNQVTAKEGTTQLANSSQDAIVQLQLTEPDVRIKKGVVAVSGAPGAALSPGIAGPFTFTPPGSAGARWTGTINSTNLATNPIDSNLTGVDQADIVTFAIVLENTGSSPSGAFDVRVRDGIPAGFSIPATGAGLNLRVSNGAGTVMPYTGVATDIFGAGIELTDTGTGAIGADDPSNGLNIVIITYDLQVDPGVTPFTAMTNTATLSNFAGTEGGPDHTTVDRTDTATVTSRGPLVSKAVITTDQAFTTGNNVAIGEIVTYTVTMTVPEGVVNNAILTDTLPLGMAIRQVTAVNVSAGLSATTMPTTGNGVISAVGASPDGDGRRIVWNMGTLTNGDTNDGAAETIAITLEAVVINGGSNDRGDTRANSATLTFTGGTGTVTANAPSVTIVEPTLQVAKVAIPNTGDAGDEVTFTVTVTHAPGSNATAFDVTVADVVPSGMTFVALDSATPAGGSSIPSNSLVAGGFTSDIASFPVGASVTYTFRATLDNTLSPGQILTNTAFARWTTLAGAPGQSSANNPLSFERTGNTSDPGGNSGADNDNVAQGSATVTANAPTPSKTIVTTDQSSTTGNNVAIGEVVTYQVQVAVPEGTSNTVRLVDTLPAGMVFVSFDSLTPSGSLSTSMGTFANVLSGVALSNGNRTATFNFGTLTNSDNNNATTETITFVYKAVVLNVAGNQAGTNLTNNAVWSSATSSTSASAPQVTVVEPVLQVTKTVAPTSTPDAGDTVTFTLTVTHAGPSNADAFDVSLSDILPSGLTFVGGTLNSTGTATSSLTEAGGTISATWSAFPLASSTVITFQAKLDGNPTPVAPGAAITNVANIAWTSLPGNPGQITTNSASAYERTGSTSDPGGAVNDYRATASRTLNVPSSSLSGFVFVDADNNGVRTGSDPAIAGVTILLTGTDNLGNTVTLSTTTNAAGAYSFTGLRPGTYTVRELQPAGYDDGPDTVGTPGLGATAGNDVLGTMTFPAATNTTAINFNFGEHTTADLSITKTGTPATVLPGGNVTYTLTARNNGPSAAVNALITDPLPGGTTFVSVTPQAGWSCPAPSVGAPGTVTCGIPSFGSGATATFTVTVKVNADVVAHSVLTNVATITSDSADLDPTNNKDDETTVVAAATDADLEVTKVDMVDPTALGAGNVTYWITVRNHGPATTDATVTDTLPASMTFVSATPSTGSCTPGNPLVCTIPGMAAGATETISVLATPNAVGVSINTVTVTGTAPDPNPANDSDTEDTTVIDPAQAELQIRKTAPLTVARGGNLTYTLVIRNVGMTATGVVVADTLAQPGLTFIGNTGACVTAFPCSLPDMNHNDTLTIRSTYAVDAAYAGANPIENTATVASVTPDSNPANNTSTVSTLVADPSAADLTIVKVDSPDATVAGTNVAYTLVVTNNGPGTATGVTVDDTLPAGVTVVSATSSLGTCSGTTSVSCNLGTMANGSIATISVVVQTASALPAPNPIVNSATVSSVSTDPEPGNNTATQPTTIVAQTDLSITKTAAATVNAGQNLVYTITVTNNGPSDAQNVNVADVTPSGLTFVSNAGACTTAFPCALGTVTAGASRTITATFLVPSSYTSPTPIQNTAVVTTDTPETNTINNSATASTTLTFDSDLAITKVGPPTIVAGNNAVYTITVTNNGPSDASGVTVSDPTPGGLTFVSNAGDCVTTFPCSLGAMAVGATRTITATFSVPPGFAAPSFMNTATVSATQGDSNSSNNTASYTTLLGAPRADLAITKTGPPTVIPGNNVTFTITVTNNGPSDAAAVTVTDPTPAGLTFVSNTGDCSGAFPCVLGTMTPGSTRTITAVYSVPPGYTTPDPIVNTAVVSSSTTDSDPSNNSATAEVSVGADLSITKNATPEPVAAGSNLTFMIVATNGGARDAVDLVINDTVPAGTTFVSANASTGGSCVTPSVGSTGAVTCTWAGVTAMSETRTLVLVVKVDAGSVAGTTIANTATTTSATNDPDPTNNTATSTSTVTTAADIALTKTVNNASPNVGDEVTYTVTATNNGPSNATGVAVTESLPVGLEFVEATPSQGSYDQPSGLWTIGAINTGASVTLQVRVRVLDAGIKTNTATKTAGDQLDPDTSNNTAAATLTSNPVADVRVLKTSAQSAANVGSTVTFTITASNAGPSDATGVQISDVLPSGLTFVSASPTVGSFDPATGLWDLGALALNAQVTLTIEATVNQTGPIVNEARRVAQNELDPNAANDASGATVNGLAADVQVVKTVSAPAGTRVGQNVTFFITASNNGPSAATGVRILDLLPAGLAYVSSSASRGVYVPQTGIWEVGDLAVTGTNATATLQVVATVISMEAITNRASVMHSDQPDPNVLNNSSVATVMAVPVDLAVEITRQGDPAAIGSTVDFHVTVTNVGDQPSVEPLIIALPVPPEYRYHPIDTPGWDCTLVGRTVFCRSLATIMPGRSVTTTFRMDILEAPPLGRAIFAHITTGPDVVARNDVDQLYIGPPPAPDPDMSVTQSVVVSGAGATKTLTYTIEVTNQGPQDAAGIVLTDVLPDNVTLVSATAPNGPCTVSGKYVVCEFGSEFAGHHKHATFVLTATSPGVVIHTVSTSSDGHDMYPRDNQSVLVTTLAPAPNADTDADGMPDAWESMMGLSAGVNDANGDADGDGVSNLQEYKNGTHPRGSNRQYFAEGASNNFFTTTLAVLNPSTDSYASVMIELLKFDGTIVSEPHLLAPLGRVEVNASTLVPEGATFSVMAESDRPIVVDRDMRWDSRGYGSSGESGIPAPSTTWYFAEGATGPYSLFYLIENPSMTQTADVQVTYLLPGGQAPIVTTESVPAHTRQTVFVNDVATKHPQLAANEIGATIVSTNGVPIVAERAMYLNVQGQPMGAGHAGQGATSPSTSWFFAEGATGAFFSEYLTLANPNPQPTVATVRYMLPDGTAFEKPYPLAATSRRTIDVEGEDPRLASTSVAAIVTTTLPIVAERVMWWPGKSFSPGWYEAHVSLGATVTGLGWGIAGAAVGGDVAEKTYAMIANQESRAGEARVTVTFDDGKTVVRTLDLAATSRTTVDFSSVFPETKGVHFSAIVDSVGASPVPIVVEWSRYSSPGGQFWGAGSAALATKIR